MQPRSVWRVMWMIGFVWRFGSVDLLFVEMQTLDCAEADMRAEILVDLRTPDAGMIYPPPFFSAVVPSHVYFQTTILADGARRAAGRFTRAKKRSACS